MLRTIKDINEKIKRGKACVVTAEEIIDLVDKNGVKKEIQISKTLKSTKSVKSTKSNIINNK